MRIGGVGAIDVSAPGEVVEGEESDTFRGVNGGLQRQVIRHIFGQTERHLAAARAIYMDLGGVGKPHLS